MDVVTGLVVAPLVLGLSWWGGRMLARHYSDEWEVLGVLLVAGSLLAPGVIWGVGALTLTGPVCAAGLVGGYDRGPMRGPPGRGDG
jgi:hypothetical protein